MYDIVFLSYNEPHAEQHWELVKSRFPRARHVAGVKGIPQAHRAAAEKCKTRYFWVIDADNIINDDFDLTFNWTRTDEHQDRVAVWKAYNNVNGLEYGYGGIKLLPRRAVLTMPDDVVDFTTNISERFHPMDEVASTTVINASPFEAWKAGFRECTKLASLMMKGDFDTNEKRLSHWINSPLNVENAEHCIRGAILGSRYGYDWQGHNRELSKINDWEWLREQFDTQVV